MSREEDLLEQATRALRADPPPTKEELADGRAVLLWAQRGARKKQRARTLRWVLPLAAVLTAGSALAATGHMERVTQAVAAWLAPEERGAEKPRAKRMRAPVAEPVTGAPPAAGDAQPRGAASIDEPSAAEPQVAAAPAERAEPKPPARPRGREPVRVSEPEPAEPADVVDARLPVQKPSPDLAAYREAHGLHFRARDFSAALAAWDAYLEAYPHGTFALEALYNRAICLLRLGRKEDARRALTPFARGAMQGGYRRAEATELLEALE